jgi:hypothetical protein
LRRASAKPQAATKETPMTLHRLALPVVVVFASLIITPRADAQLLWRLFGPKTTDKNPPPKNAQPDPRRSVEVNVEIAWLADPVTFPYYLEAKIASSKLEVRGYVPNKAVREHAMRIAQMYSSLPVIDSMKEHASLTVKSNPMPAAQLQKSAVSSLKVALPKQYQQLKVESGADGKVFVLGTVSTIEEKMAVSNALRRLHGCTSVQNLTMLATEVAQNPPNEKTPFVKTSNPKEKPMVAQDKSKPWLQFPWSKNNSGSTKEPPLLDQSKDKNKGPTIVDTKKPDPKEGPILITNGAPVVKDNPPAPSTKPLSANELRKRIMAAFPQAKNVDVQMAANQEVRITIEIRSENEITAAAERIFAIPELENLRPELQFKVSAP